jgi:3-phenylpropionate/trans-cinnamate dioxygenase ferredoxin reductase subunit
VILGAGQAGGRAAETLRAEGFEGRVIVVGAEPHRPYERPPLSKGLLVGDTSEEQIFLRPADFYAEQEIEVLLGVSATGVSPDTNTVSFSDGQVVRYDKLLLATGVRARTLPIPGADLPGVHVLRTLEDARSLIRAMAGSPRVVIAGAGFVGAEVAAACRMRGLGVIVVEPLATPMQRVVGERVGTRLAEIHRAHGVDLRLRMGVAAFRGGDRVAEAVLENGETLDCDLALIAVGSEPDTGYLAGSGINREDGVVVDEYCRTNVPNIYAAGDVARWHHPLYGEYLRVEHWDNAEQQGAAAARSMLGASEPYAPIPYFWSDQYDAHLQCVGHIGGGEQEVIRGNVDGNAFTIFYLRDDRLMAALCLNSPRDAMAARRLIAAHQPVDVSQLVDTGVDLRKVASTRREKA